MTWTLGVLISLLLGGIILLNIKSPIQHATREEFLQKLAEFLGGTLERIGEEGEGNSFRIQFKYKDEECIYEDLEKQGFKDKVYEAYLKIKTPSKLTLTFTEKKRSTKVRSEIFIASDVSAQYMEEHAQIQAPKHLKDMKIFASDVVEANEIFENKKATAVLKKYRNIDGRGYPFLSIEIIDGVVALEFHSVKTYKPNISRLREDITSIDGYLEKLLIIAHQLKKKE